MAEILNRQPLANVVESRNVKRALARAHLIVISTNYPPSLTNRNINPDRLFRFRINPQSLRVRKARVQAYELTKAGYERYDFGNEMWVLSYRGTSGRLIPEDLMVGETFDLTDTDAWKKMEEFDRFFTERGEETLQLTATTLLGFLYLRGSMKEFDFEQDANDPFQIRYNFTFWAFPTNDGARFLLG
jgi:hypothetical protein